MADHHEEKEPPLSDDDDLYDISDDDSGAGSLSDAYFMRGSSENQNTLGSAKMSSHSLCYSPTSPVLGNHLLHSKRPPGTAVPTLHNNNNTGKSPSIKTGDVFYQGNGRTWWHASEYDPLYDSTTAASSRHSSSSYGGADSFRPIQEDEEMIEEEEEEEKVVMTMSKNSLDPHGVLPNPRREKRRLRQLRKKQMEQIAREQRVKQVRGVPQEDAFRTCHDVVFCALFVAQLVLVIFCAIKFGSGVVFFENTSWSPFPARDAQNANDDDDNTARFLSSATHATSTTTDDDSALSQFVSDNVKASSNSTSSSSSSSSTNHAISQVATSFVLNYKTVMSIVGITGFYACILSLVTVGFMLIIAKSLIETALIFCILLSLAWGVIGYVVEPQHYLVPAFGFVALVLFVAYTVVVWDRIPFSAANLNTALCAMRSTADITLLGMTMLLVSFAWCLVWCMAFIGLVDTLNECEPGDMSCRQHHSHGHVFLFIMFFFSFYWTNVVINSITRVTVASAVGTWWFHPEEISPCCSRPVLRAFVRSITTSLGSICLGSLVVVPAQMIAAVAQWCCCTNVFRYRPITPQRGCCGMVQEFTLWLRRCNRWSFSYIGMYGYRFYEGGEKAIALFETREWLDVVNDKLIHNVLLMASIVIGGSTGVFGVLVEEVDGYTFTSFHKPVITAFLIGSVLGFVLSNVLLLGVVGSAVNTILVCFAAGPFEFHKNHPLLSQEMRDVWSNQVWEPSV